MYMKNCEVKVILVGCGHCTEIKSMSSASTENLGGQLRYSVLGSRKAVFGSQHLVLWKRQREKRIWERSQAAMQAVQMMNNLCYYDSPFCIFYIRLSLASLFLFQSVKSRTITPFPNELMKPLGCMYVIRDDAKERFGQNGHLLDTHSSPKGHTSFPITNRHTHICMSTETTQARIAS